MAQRQAATTALDDYNDPIVTVAQWIAHFALLIYFYTFVGCRIFASSFFRQLAFMFQFIKLFMIFASLLPCVLHSQANALFPGVMDSVGRVIVIASLLVINIFLAVKIWGTLESCYMEGTTKKCCINTCNRCWSRKKHTRIGCHRRRSY